MTTFTKKYLEDKNGTKFVPVTSTSAVRDEDGNSLDTLLGNKQDTLTFDNTPTKNSTNPITSNGVYDTIYVNKAYDPEHYSGLGKVVLEKNLVGGVNTLTQAMLASGWREKKK